MIAIGFAILVGAPVRSMADIPPAATPTAPLAVSPIWPPVSTGPLLMAIDFSLHTAQAIVALPPWPAASILEVPARDAPVTINPAQAVNQPARPRSNQRQSPQADITAPLGLSTVRAPLGLLWVKWRRVEAEIDATEPALARCARSIRYCSAGTARFAAIVKQARREHGRDRIELINRRINAAIRYRSDMAQWYDNDVWSAPLEVHRRGSFDTGFGDCEDLAIAKYVALRSAGARAADLRLLIVRDTSAHTDHAVLAVRDGDRWLILDNRWSRLIEENDAAFFAPLFALDAAGVQSYPAAAVASAKPTPHKPTRWSSAEFHDTHRDGLLSGRSTNTGG
jgi:predicted transglutaminase-like cysteine proteinase